MFRFYTWLILLVLVPTLAGSAEIEYRPRATPEAEQRVVATYHGRPMVWMSNIDQSLSIFYYENAKKIHQRRIEWLRVFIEKQLLAVEAQKRGIGVEELLRTERNEGISRAEYVGKLWEEAKITIRLPEPDPPQVVVNEFPDSPVLGLEAAGSDITVFCSFDSARCGQVWKTLRGLTKKFGYNMRVVHRDYPDSPASMNAAVAARCAGRQEKFWPYHSLLYAKQPDLKSDSLKRYARELGLDAVKFNDCLEKRGPAGDIERDIQAGKLIGLSGVPSVFINTYYFDRSRPVEELEEVISGEVGRFGPPLPVVQ